MFIISDLHFHGYAVRYLRPEVSASWKVEIENYFNLLYCDTIILTLILILHDLRAIP